ncbi:hypothetical protein L596_025212 [Steinernema carpocapsae]|uniref:SH3 domain-containing protein n=1 Tax=Steinernema carpocapsae TaxID=34508 RepID=A0A4U5M7A6_STECR|nr:hypothetical protein L596_025212 [Steinernema carpocapsae]
MTLNVRNHEHELRELFKEVTEQEPGKKWAIFGYEGNSNILKIVETGDDGLEGFCDAFDAGHLLYGVIAIQLPGITNPKVILVHWQGEGVSFARLSATANHGSDVQAFFKTIHMTINARSEVDVDSQAITAQIQKTVGNAAQPATNGHQDFVQPQPVGSVYKPVKPQAEVVSVFERNRFWQKQDEEEKSRKQEELKELKRAQPATNGHQEYVQPQPVGSVYKPVKPHAELASVSERNRFWQEQDEEEKRRKQEEQKRAQEEVQRMAKERDQMVSNFQRQAVVQESQKLTTYRSERPVGADSKKLVSDRAKMFQQKAEDLAASAIHVNKPEPSGKPKAWQMKTTAKVPALAPVFPRPQAEKEPMTPTLPTTPVPPPPTPAVVAEETATSPPAAEEIEEALEVARAEEEAANIPEPDKEEAYTNGNHSYELPPVDPAPVQPSPYYPSTVMGTRAIALWDYQAQEDNEISFEPDDYIEDIERCHEDWWRGKAPNGQFGLFPANYVKLV